MKRIAIVGGGITGLATAYRLERLTNASIDLYEADSRLGGKLQTEQTDGFIIESGPDCFFARKPGAMELVAEFGMEDQLIEPLEKQFMMLVNGKLHHVPGGLVTFTQGLPNAVSEATFLSAKCKARVGEEVIQPKAEREDESIRSFFTRRFGEEFSRLVAEPLLAGTHGGDPDLLSMRALYPGYFNLERKHGSLSAGMQNRTLKDPAETRKSSFLSFKDGMQTIVDALSSRLSRTRIHLENRVNQLPDADRVVVATPSTTTKSLLPGIGLEQIKYRSSTIFTVAFRRDNIDHPMDGTGFLVPPQEASAISGATWSSQKWAGRAPDGLVLMRLFLREECPSEAAALKSVVQLLGINGSPLFTQSQRWQDALPQYEVGHLNLIDSIEKRLPPNVFIAGTSYRGVGVPDCLRQGHDIALRIAESL